MRIIIVTFTFLILKTGTATALEPWIEWEILNNHRILNGAAEQEKFYGELRRYIRCGDYRLKNKRRVCRQLNRYRKGKHWNPSDDGYKTAWRNRTNAFDKSYVHNRVRRVVLYPKKIRVRSASTCEWRIDGESQASKNCRIIVPLSLGEHEISVTVKRNRTAKPKTISQNLRIRDILVVLIGDSFNSGEGNPHVLWEEPRREFPDQRTQPAIWWDARCHRSLFGGGALAAARLAQWNKRISVTLVSYACSGAEFGEGLLKEYVGRETVTQVRRLYRRHREDRINVYLGNPIHAQVDEMSKTLCANPGQTVMTGCEAFRVPDYLILSTGGNEIGFSKIVERLARKNCKTPCQNEIRAQVSEKMAQLGAEFRSLKSKLNAFGSRHTILLEYLDLTKADNGEFCDDRTANQKSFIGTRWFRKFLAIHRHESKFAYELLSKLNATLKEIATAPDMQWRIIDDLAYLSRNRGYCAKRSWFNTYRHSLEKQGELPADDAAGRTTPVSVGAMHPNIYGHNGIGMRLADEFGCDGLLKRPQNCAGSD